MPLTAAELNEITLLVCPVCRRGVARRLRPETNEWVHDISGESPIGNAFYQHCICWASGLLTSQLAKEITS
jgi:hypothetical protein